MNRPVYLAFCTGPLASTVAFLHGVGQHNPDSTLLAVARERPCDLPNGAEWVEIGPRQRAGAIVAACRRAIEGRDVAGAAVHATRQGGAWRMRIAALRLAGSRLRIYNDHLDHFAFGDTGTLWQHLKWRWRQRRRGVLWWSLLEALAVFAANHPFTRRSRKSAQPFPAAIPRQGISLVIPTRDGRDLLMNLLPQVVADLRAHTHEIIVVDNGSSDGTAAFLRDTYPGVRIESSPTPLSFSTAVNRGILSARFSHIVLLNNDMIVEPGFFAALRRAFDQVPQLFCATAQIFFPQGERRQETGLCFWRPGLSDDFPVYCAEPAEGEDGTLVLYGSGGCSMYDTSKLRDLGGFDEVYQPAYVEDLDIGYRGWMRGWPTVFCAGARVLHHHRATTSRYYRPEYLDYLVERNYLRFLVRATGDIFPEVWQEAVARLKHRAAGGDAAARRTLWTAWREALSREPASHAESTNERALKQSLTK